MELIKQWQSLHTAYQVGSSKADSGHSSNRLLVKISVHETVSAPHGVRGTVSVEVGEEDWLGKDNVSLTMPFLPPEALHKHDLLQRCKLPACHRATLAHVLLSINSITTISELGCIHPLPPKPSLCYLGIEQVLAFPFHVNDTEIGHLSDLEATQATFGER